MSRINQLESALNENGLKLRGEFLPCSADHPSILNAFKGPVTLALVGNIGSSLWPSFSCSEEFKDGQPHPLDRWSRRIGDQLADAFQGKALYPFDGPPYWPFLSWTQKAEDLISSPLGLRFHPKYGLWHAYRFALLLPFKFDKEGFFKADDESFDCTNCYEQACLNACPVGAFDGVNYNTSNCTKYLVSNPQASCNSHGCLARHACPIGQQYAYEPQQARFHMNAFKTARAMHGD